MTEPSGVHPTAAGGLTRHGWWSIVLLVGLLTAVFGVARWLHPWDERGRPLRRGTHEQLGLAPCHFLRATGWPCPTCGLTTSVSLTVHGDIGAAMKAHPMGPALVVLGLAVWGWGVAMLVRGRWLGPTLRDEWIAAAVVVLVGGLAVAWTVRWAASWHRPVAPLRTDQGRGAIEHGTWTDANLVDRRGDNRPDGHFGRL
jgi:hypothetical protein